MRQHQFARPPKSPILCKNSIWVPTMSYMWGVERPKIPIFLMARDFEINCPPEHVSVSSHFGVRRELSRPTVNFARSHAWLTKIDPGCSKIRIYDNLNRLAIIEELLSYSGNRFFVRLFSWSKIFLFWLVHKLINLEDYWLMLNSQNCFTTQNR